MKPSYTPIKFDQLKNNKYYKHNPVVRKKLENLQFNFDDSSNVSILLQQEQKQENKFLACTSNRKNVKNFPTPNSSNFNACNAKIDNNNSNNKMDTNNSIDKENTKTKLKRKYDTLVEDTIDKKEKHKLIERNRRMNLKEKLDSLKIFISSMLENRKCSHQNILSKSK